MMGRIGLGSLAGALLFTGLGGCAKKPPTPEEQCSSQSTYDQVTELLAGQIAQARAAFPAGGVAPAASSISALKAVLRFEMPTVTDFNAATHKVTCAAMMRVTADAPTQQTINTEGLDTNEVTPDHLQLRIRYSMQPSADTGSPILEVEQGSALAAVAMQASMAAVQRVQQAAGTGTPMPASSVPPPDAAQSSASDASTDSAQPQSLVPQDAGQSDDGPSAPSNDVTGPNADRARAFATEYFSRSQGDADAALSWMAAHYADNVRFFGTNTGRADILKQKADYLRRWPQRSYTVEPASVGVECKTGQALCHVSGIIDWSAASSARGAAASGKSAFDLVTLASGDDQAIVAENSRVISRGQ